MLKKFIVLVLLHFIGNLPGYGQEIKTHYLANGIPVIFYQLKDVPTGALGVLIKGGVLKLNKGYEGLEYLTLRTVLTGSKKVPYPNFSKRLKELGIELNVTSSREYSLITLRALRRYLEEGINLIYDGLTDPDLDPQAFMNIKRELKKNALRRNENPNSRVWDMVNRVFYDEHPLFIEPEGTVQSIDGLQLQDVSNYLDILLNSNLFMLCVAGNYAADSILHILNSTFGKIPRKNYTLPSAPPLNTPKQDTLVIDSMMLKTAYFAAKVIGPNPRDPEYFSALLGFSVLGRRLWDSLRTEYGLTYATGAGLSLSNFNYGYLYFSSAKPDSAYLLLRKELDNILRKPITEREVNRARNLWHTYFYMRQATTSRIVRYLLMYEYLGYGAEQFLRLPTQLEHVTPKMIQKALNRYLKNLVMAMLLPKNQ